MSDLPPMIQLRIDKIVAWLTNEKLYLSSKKVKVTLNISDEHVKGEITAYPDSN